MATSVQDIITEQRFLVRDTVTAKYLWSDAEMVYALNEALRQIGLRVPIWDDSGEYNITLVANQSRYSYDSSIFSIEDITRASDSRSLEKITYTDKDYQSVENWRDDAEGFPEAYIENTDDCSIVVYPIPSTTFLDSLILNVYRLPRSNYTTTNMATTYIREPNVEKYRFAILMGMQAYLYRKTDSNTYRPDMADYAEAKFNQLIGMPVDMRTLEARRRNSNKTLQYVPHPYSSRVRHSRTYYDRFDTDTW